MCIRTLHVPSHRGPNLWRIRYGADGRPDGLPLSAVAVRLHRSEPGWILAVNSRRERPLDSTDVRLIGLAGAMLVKQHHHARLYAELKEALVGLVRCLTTLIEAKDSCTAGHSERVSRIAVRIGRQSRCAKHAPPLFKPRPGRLKLDARPFRQFRSSRGLSC
jgi:hypothetical protein